MADTKVGGGSGGGYTQADIDALQRQVKEAKDAGIKEQLEAQIKLAKEMASAIRPPNSGSGSGGGGIND